MPVTILEYLQALILKDSTSVTIYTSPICSCIICHKEYSQKGIHSHYIVNHVDGKRAEFIKRNNESKHKSSATLKSKVFSNSIEKWKTYYKSPRICSVCNCEIDWFKRTNKNCSSSCSTTIANKNRVPRSVESKQKTSNSNKLANKTNPREYKSIVSKIGFCKICNILIKGSNLTCSKECLRINASINASNRLKDPEYRKSYGRGKKSYMESSFEQWLDARLITYETEFTVRNYILNKSYYTDFTFHNLKLIIELDGNQHLKTIEQDRIRDEYIFSTLGYYVFRISHKEYQKFSKLEIVKLMLL